MEYQEVQYQTWVSSNEQLEEQKAIDLATGIVSTGVRGQWQTELFKKPENNRLRGLLEINEIDPEVFLNITLSEEKELLITQSGEGDGPYKWAVVILLKALEDSDVFLSHLSEEQVEELQNLLLSSLMTKRKIQSFQTVLSEEMDNLVRLKQLLTV